jgi:hypothetical protein
VWLGSKTLCNAETLLSQEIQNNRRTDASHANRFVHTSPSKVMQVIDRRISTAILSPPALALRTHPTFGLSLHRVDLHLIGWLHYAWPIASPEMRSRTSWWILFAHRNGGPARKQTASQPIVHSLSDRISGGFQRYHAKADIVTSLPATRG